MPDEFLFVFIKAREKHILVRTVICHIYSDSPCILFLNLAVIGKRPRAQSVSPFGSASPSEVAIMLRKQRNVGNDGDDSESDESYSSSVSETASEPMTQPVMDSREKDVILLSCSRRNWRI